MVVLGPRPLTVEEVVAVARHRDRVEVDGGVAAAMALAHAALVLTGGGWALDENGRAVDASPHLAAAGLEPVRLTAKEGLALLNGTEGMLAHLCLALADLGVLLPTADVACAMSVEALL